MDDACGALLTDLSKSFDCLPHELLITTFHAYSFDMKSLNLLYDYLPNRQQRVKVDEANSSWRELLYGVPLGSVLVPSLPVQFFCL